MKCRVKSARFAFSIKAYIAATHAKNVQQPVHLDASQPSEQWAGVPRDSCDVIVAINLLQYSSFKTAQVGVIMKKLNGYHTDFVAV